MKTLSRDQHIYSSPVSKGGRDWLSGADVDRQLGRARVRSHQSEGPVWIDGAVEDFTRLATDSLRQIITNSKTSVRRIFKPFGMMTAPLDTVNAEKASGFMHWVYLDVTVNEKAQITRARLVDSLEAPAAQSPIRSAILKKVQDAVDWVNTSETTLVSFEYKGTQHDGYSCGQRVVSGILEASREATKPQASVRSGSQRTPRQPWTAQPSKATLAKMSDSDIKALSAEKAGKLLGSIADKFSATHHSKAPGYAKALLKHDALLGKVSDKALVAEFGESTVALQRQEVLRYYQAKVKSEKPQQLKGDVPPPLTNTPDSQNVFNPQPGS